MSRVAFLGLGRMGSPMAANLARAGHVLVVWNRTHARAVEFTSAQTATAARTPREAVTDAEFIVTMLADDAAMRDAYHGDNGILAGLAPGAVAIDMSTVSPETVVELAQDVAKAGATLVDAPVSGSVAAAAAGSLTIMAAGDRDAVDRAHAVLGDLGEPVIYMGESGRGSIMKLCVNAIVHGLNGAVSESLVLAERCGIDRLQAYAVFLNSAIAAPFVLYRQAAFESPDEVPVAFRLELAAKDLRLALEAAERAGAKLPQTGRTHEVLAQAVAAGFGDLDESAVAKYLRNSGGTTQQTGPLTKDRADERSSQE
jgi:3-hydroxyisobutyrate dehydrogenase-like beta-hydroxyacid dehydrogenase